jgi:hypothetical protein
LQDFVNFKTFLRKKAEKRLKEESKVADVCLNIDVLFAL